MSRTEALKKVWAQYNHDDDEMMIMMIIFIEYNY